MNILVKFITIIIGSFALLCCVEKPNQNTELILKQVIEEKEIEINEILNTFKRKYADDPAKVEPSYLDGLKVDSAFTNHINDIELIITNSNSKRNIQLIENIIADVNQKVTINMPWLKDSSFLPVLNLEANLNNQYLSTLKLGILQAEHNIIKELLSEIGGTQCFSSMIRKIWVLDNLETDSSINGHYNGTITLAEVPIYLGKYGFRLDSIKVNEILQSGNHSIDTIDGRFRLKIESTKKGKYNWQGRYFYMKPNGRWDTVKLERTFIVN